MLADKLTRILAASDGERAVAAFLKKHPEIVLRVLVRFGDGNIVVSEFPLGTEHKADFVALAPFSGGWELHFVELEPPTERLFNDDGTMAKRLNKANSQIDSWRTFFEKNRHTVLRDLARFAQERDLIRGPRETEPKCHAGWPLYHPRSWLHLHFDIVIGRRGKLSDSALEAKAAFKDHHNIQVMTYDRFVDAARMIE
jgi:hypothetical protein